MSEEEWTKMILSAILGRKLWLRLVGPHSPRKKRRLATATRCTNEGSNVACRGKREGTARAGKSHFQPQPRGDRGKGGATQGVASGFRERLIFLKSRFHDCNTIAVCTICFAGHRPMEKPPCMIRKNTFPILRLRGTE